MHTQGYQLTPVATPNVLGIPISACLPVSSSSWFPQNLWILSVIIIVGLFLLALLTWLACFRHARPAIIQVSPRVTAPLVLPDARASSGPRLTRGQGGAASASGTSPTDYVVPPALELLPAPTSPYHPPQAVITVRKRVRGEPTSGPITVVNTDIEGKSPLQELLYLFPSSSSVLWLSRSGQEGNTYPSLPSPLAATTPAGFSDLFKASPELMGEALGIHNGIVRKARWANFGCEGRLSRLTPLLGCSVLFLPCCQLWHSRTLLDTLISLHQGRFRDGYLAHSVIRGRGSPS